MLSRSMSPSSEGGDPGNDSDEDQTYPFESGINSMEMSLWSLDASATSSIDTSTSAELEVSEQYFICV